MKLAAIDIGSNSIHMVIVSTDEKHGIRVLDREKEMVKLGAGVFKTHQLSDRAFEEGLETLDRYVKLADGRDVDEILAVATSAVREAKNGGDFLDEVNSRTGIAPRVISGAEEARMIFLAARKAIELEGKKTVVIDIGGGSMEVVVGDDEDVFFGESVKLGVQRLLDLADREESIVAEARRVLEGHIEYVAHGIVERAKEIGFKRVIGTSGTIRSLGEAAHRAAGGDSWRDVNAQVVPVKALKKLADDLVEMDMEERAEVSSISERRADAIHLGGVLLVHMLDLLGAKKITLCDASLREGVILDYIERHPEGGGMFPSIPDVRHRSVVELARRFGRYGKRESHVEKLAQQIFDQTQEIHSREDYERDILRYAALLHGIGQYISFRRHHKHGRYLIKHSKLRGFSDEEALLLRHVVRYHRKAHPGKRHKKFKRMTKAQRQIVRELSGILRIAVSLDRGHSQGVEEIACRISDDAVRLEVSGAEDIELELWAARRHKKPLEKALGRDIKIQQG